MSRKRMQYTQKGTIGMKDAAMICASLPKEQQDEIDALAFQLTQQIPLLGHDGAAEILMKIGMQMALEGADTWTS